MATKRTRETLMDLLGMKLQALYDVEQQLVKALPQMAKAATDPELKQGFQNHLEETKNHVVRLVGAFRILGIKEKSLKGDAIRGIVEDAKWCIKNIKDKQARDAHLVASASYAEHHEMAGYMSAIAWAKELGLSEIVTTLEETLGEEEAVDEKMSVLSRTKLVDRVEKNNPNNNALDLQN